MIIILLSSFATTGFRPLVAPLEETSRRMFRKRFHRTAHRSFAILELRWFGPMSKLGNHYLYFGIRAFLEPCSRDTNARRSAATRQTSSWAKFATSASRRFGGLKRQPERFFKWALVRRRQFCGIPRTRRLSEGARGSSSALSSMTSWRDGASSMMRLRCSGLGSVIFAFSRSLTRRTASIWTCVQPSGCGVSARLRTTRPECLSATLKAHPI